MMKLSDMPPWVVVTEINVCVRITSTVYIKKSQFYCVLIEEKGFPNSPDAGDLGSIPGLRRSLGEGNGSPLQYPCLENFMDRGAWWAVVYGVSKSQTRLSD